MIYWPIHTFYNHTNIIKHCDKDVWWINDLQAFSTLQSFKVNFISARLEQHIDINMKWLQPDIVLKPGRLNVTSPGLSLRPDCGYWGEPSLRCVFSFSGGVSSSEVILHRCVGFQCFSIISHHTLSQGEIQWRDDPSFCFKSLCVETGNAFLYPSVVWASVDVNVSGRKHSWSWSVFWFSIRAELLTVSSWVFGWGAVQGLFNITA